ncbi:hypothetical protein JQX13_11215 [Archangium violaceum]|uniref:hypothetical protein n=1 Tax=Archangium violaceum TaxID=83451 RepID=UPI00193B0F9D|nr:hypothetical protein [Archangium violaceum]QRK10598.1 hypothetical protein JQX13_11215 [Archangium violaceum]
MKETHPLPPELMGPVPRKDVWGERGYLGQPRSHATLLHHPEKEMHMRYEAVRATPK